MVLDFIFKYLITYPEIKSEKILNYAINNYQLCYFNIYYSYFTFYLNYFLNKKDKAETLKKIYLNQSLWEDLMKQHLFYTAVVNEYPINSKTYIPEYIFDVTSFPIRINSSHKQFKNILKNKIPSLFFILKEDNLKLKMWKKVKTNKRYSFLKSELINSFNKNPKMAIYNLKIKALTILAQDIPEIYSMPSQSNKKNQTLFLAIIENHFISMDLSEKELKSKFKWLFSLFKTRYIKQLFYQEEKVLNSLFQKNGLYSYWEILLSQIELEKLKNDFNNENLHQIKSL